MRILHLTPGTGSFFCGSCLRDAALVHALRERGHDAVMMPLYLPFVLESETESPDRGPVRMGGINLYLQQKVPVLRGLPRALRGLLDRPGLLRFVARRANMTDAPLLGEMTLSTLRGEDGRQVGEVTRLAHEVAERERPDVLCLSNAMLVGLVAPLHRALGVPIAVTLQGEQPFLDSLPPPWRERAWDALRERVAEVDAFLAVSRFTADLMTERLGLRPERVHVAHNGIDLAPFASEPTPPSGPPTIGFLARMCREKGLDTLVDAFLELKAAGTVPGLRLAACGVELAEDRPFVAELRARVARAGHAADFAVHPNVTREEKLAFLRGLSVLSVPATYGESFGLYVLEALACGVPVVQPRSGAFEELLAATGGGLLCEPDDARSLAASLAELLTQPALARDLGRSGRDAVRRDFGAAAMARRVEAVLQGLPSGSGG